MEIKHAAVLAGLFVLFIVLLIVFVSGDGEKIQKPSSRDSADPCETEAEIRETLVVKLFFLSQKDNLLHPEEREVWADSSEIRQVRQTLQELLSGPDEEGLSPFPAGTELREIYITKQGIAYVDFSREMESEHSSGSAAEIATVFSIVNTLTYNFDSIKRVFILINGGERETLAGHIDLRRPLLPRFDLIAEN
jgi:spore germination protein GerM